MTKVQNAFAATRDKRRTKTVTLPESGVEVTFRSLGGDEVDVLLDIISDPETLDALQREDYMTIAATAKESIAALAASSSQSEDLEEARQDVLGLGLEDIGEIVMTICEVTFSKGIGSFLSALKTRMGIDGMSRKVGATIETTPTTKTETRTDAEADLAPMGPMDPSAFAAS